MVKKKEYVEVRELMSDNEMLSHIFLGCIKHEDLMKIRDEFIKEKDWQIESVKIPVEMYIGGVYVNPKEFFNSWKEQMERMILNEAKKLVSANMGSIRIQNIQGSLSQFEEILKNWEEDINWTIDNPLLQK